MDYDDKPNGFSFDTSLPPADRKKIEKMKKEAGVESKLIVRHVCTLCGREYKRTHGRQRLCPECKSIPAQKRNRIKNERRR